MIQTRSWQGDVVQQARQPGRAGGKTDQAHVQADRHHLGHLGALGVKRVEAVADDGEPVIGGADAAQEIAPDLVCSGGTLSRARA